MMFRSYRTKLQVAFVLLGLIAIGVTGYEALDGATAALERATVDGLTALRDTKRRQVEGYFRDVRNHVLALASDESIISALEEFTVAWPGLDPRGDDARQAKLQSMFIANNPHPEGAKDLLLSPPGGGRYGDVHARYHATLHRYLSAFGFYDIFLIDGESSRVVYTVFKETDLGGGLNVPPLAGSGLARAYQRAMQLPEPEETVMEDYAPYAASNNARAAFIATPIWRAGEKIGAVVVQVSVEELHRITTGNPNWSTEGLGRAGRAYIVRPDVGAPPDPKYEAKRAADVLRSKAKLNVPGVNWELITEIDAAEAFTPVRQLRSRILAWGAVIAVVFLAAASWLARSVTEPVLALAKGARQLGAGDFRVQIPVWSNDEIGQLGESFNQMAEDLRATTVSRDRLDEANQKLRELANRLLESQEEERKRLARELHDDITQRMASIAIEAGRLKQVPGGDAAQWRAGLDRLQQQMARLSDDIHGLSRRLHPSTLDDLGLAAAIEGECRSFFERGGPPVDIRVEGELNTVPEAVQLALYRIVQESLRNIARHADASEVTLSLRRTGGRVDLEIADDGCGFDRSSTGWQSGLGLASMDERMRLVGGSARVESQIGKGTRVRVEAPA
ncbi:MAG: HAMP domain-containing protein [Acidobacteriota bacterium]